MDENPYESPEEGETASPAVWAQRMLILSLWLVVASFVIVVAVINLPIPQIVQTRVAQVAGMCIVVGLSIGFVRLIFVYANDV